MLLQNADVANQWAGLRPGRTEVRLEAEVIAASDGKQIPVSVVCDLKDINKICLNSRLVN